MTKTLTFTLMDPPYESERSTTAMRLISDAIERGFSVNVFAYEGAVNLAFAKQTAHPNGVHGRNVEEENHPLPKVWVERLMARAKEKGAALNWINCGLCVDERGVAEAVDGVSRGTPGDLLKWAESSDNTLVIGTR